MSFVNEFKTFALKGNVVDLAVGVIIGAAFSRLVDSVVADLVMPLVSLATGRLDFSNWFVALGAVQWLSTARIVRGQVLSLKEKEFVEGARQGLLVRGMGNGDQPPRALEGVARKLDTLIAAQRAGSADLRVALADAVARRPTTVAYLAIRS